jgi:D-alanine-D-alanine ligase
MKAVVLHGRVPEGAPKDEQDVLVQVEAVSRALSDLGYDPVALAFSLDIKKAIEALHAIQPSIVFNLVESIEGQGRLIHIAPTILDFLGLPFTGARSEAMLLTSNKILAKKILNASGISTPLWLSLESIQKDVKVDGPYIIKSVWEHASIGLDAESVIFAKNANQLRHEIKDRLKKHNGDRFAEAYIEGREFNLSLLASRSGPEVLPHAEIRFIDYPEGKLRVVDYRAKWEEESFEYVHTRRCFDFPEEDKILLKQLEDIAINCWKIFGLAGYARVDFRVDQAGQPWVLEVNANPCLSPDSGFVAAAQRAGLSFHEVIERIIEDAAL